MVFWWRPIHRTASRMKTIVARAAMSETLRHRGTTGMVSRHHDGVCGRPDRNTHDAIVGKARLLAPTWLVWGDQASGPNDGPLAYSGQISSSSNIACCRRPPDRAPPVRVCCFVHIGARRAIRPTRPSVSSLDRTTPTENHPETTRDRSIRSPLPCPRSSLQGAFSLS